MTTDTYPKTIYVVHSGARLISVVDDHDEFTARQAQIAAQGPMNLKRAEQGLDPVAPPPINREAHVKHWIARGFNAIEVTNPRFEREVMDAVAMFGSGDAPELEIVASPLDMPIKQAISIAKLSTNRKAIKVWRAVETRKPVLAALDARDAAVAQTKAEQAAEQAKAAAAAGGEGQYE